MSTRFVKITQGNNKFELIAQMIDCARGIDWKSRAAFELVLQGSNHEFLGCQEGRKSVVNIKVKTSLAGFRSQGDRGDSWLISGRMCRDYLRTLDPDGQRYLRRFEYFDAVYSVRTRNGYIMPA